MRVSIDCFLLPVAAWLLACRSSLVVPTAPLSATTPAPTYALTPEQQEDIEQALSPILGRAIAGWRVIAFQATAAGAELWVQPLDPAADAASPSKAGVACPQLS